MKTKKHQLEKRSAFHTLPEEKRFSGTHDKNLFDNARNQIHTALLKYTSHVYAERDSILGGMHDRFEKNKDFIKTLEKILSIPENGKMSDPEQIKFYQDFAKI